MTRRLVVVGAGAIGGSVAALLQERGDAEVLVVARGEHGERVVQDGLLLRTPEAERRMPLRVAPSIAAVDWRPERDLALLATKLPDAPGALDELLAAAGPTLPVACLTNGIDAETWAGERFEQVVSAMVWMPASHLHPGEVTLHTEASCRGVVDVGGAACAHELAAHLRAAGFDSVVRDDIERHKRTKLLTNLGSAALALAADGEDPTALRTIVRAVRREGEQVLRAAGLEHVPLGTFRERVAHVVEAPVAGRRREGNSTWQSRQRGRTLETPWLEGTIVRLATAAGITAPANELLVAAAAHNRSPSPAELRPFHPT